MRGQRRKKLWRAAKRNQREAVRDVMLEARRFCAWLTLRQIARLTGYGEASISAQLRHLRKPQYGGFVVAKRCCGRGKSGSTGDGRRWEYRLCRKWRAAARRCHRAASHLTRRRAQRGAPWA